MFRLGVMDKQENGADRMDLLGCPSEMIGNLRLLWIVTLSATMNEILRCACYITTAYDRGTIPG
jgi:hypothetical protein